MRLCPGQDHKEMKRKVRRGKDVHIDVCGLVEGREGGRKEGGRGGV